jgi:hypothetical protein
LCAGARAFGGCIGFPKQNAMLEELQQQARGIQELSKEEHEILKELHPAVQKIEEGVDQVKESTQS